MMIKRGFGVGRRT